ncbi:MAG: glycosyltransferase family 4 protein [Bryobacteraceae bacterium]
MRLAVDATPLLLRSAGVKTYLYYWTRHLREQAGRRRLWLFPAAGRPGTCEHERSIVSAPRTLAGLLALHSANYLGSWTLEPLAAAVDVFHASHQLRRPPRRPLLTATLYDMTCWLAPEMHTAANVRASRRFAEMVLRRAAGLIAISANSRDDAVRLLGLDPGRIAVIYPGVANAFFTAAPAPREKPFALFVGTVEPRKNIPVLLDAWEDLPRSLRQEFDLVVAGPAGWGDPATLARLQSGIPGVRYLGYVPEAELPGLTAAASVFVYPSLYEGFGLPVAQAMAAGVPVVASHVSSLPEVAGKGALFIDPRSPTEIRAALERLLLSPSLRAELGARGRDRAGLYRWDEAARQSWAFFEKLAGSRG